MYYQLLGEPGPYTASKYRGINRCGPAYQEELPESASVNRAWKEYVSGYGERLPTRELAVGLAAEFQMAGRRFDIVLVKVMPSPPAERVAGLLGFDIAQHGWHSLLSWGLRWNGLVSLPPPPKAALFRVVEAYFRPLLNENCLFSQWSDARFFLDVVEAISALAPGTWESPGYEQFEILQLVEVPLAAALQEP